jgi:hypothetical protein
MDELIAGRGRKPRQRTTLYGDAPASRRRKAYGAPGLTPPIIDTRANRALAAVG